MKNTELLRISGHANASKSQQFQQIATASVTKNFYGLIAVNGDAVISVIADIKGTSQLSSFGDSKTAYEGIYYPGSFGSIKLTSGEVVIYLDDNV